MLREALMRLLGTKVIKERAVSDRCCRYREARCSEIS